MAGPGDLLLARLHVEVPYRAKIKWFVTPDGRLEAMSQLLELERVGALEGELRFHYPGHRGYPAFRGVAAMEGTTTASFPGLQVTEWRHVRWDPETGIVHSWWWEGVSKLNARWKMVATIAFDADRLRRLEVEGVIEKERDETDARRLVYRLTTKGLALAPVLVEMIVWGDRHYDTAAPAATIREMTEHRERFLPISAREMALPDRGLGSGKPPEGR